MAIWVNLNRAAKFPEVNKVYKKAGWGQGAGNTVGQPQNVGTPTSAVKGFLNVVRYYVQAASRGVGTMPAWIRLSPTGSNDWQDAQVNVSAIPGVRPLLANGKYQNSAVYNI